MLRVLAVVALLAALPVRADSVADEADFRFRRAATLYREGRVEDALGEFLASNRLVRNRNVAFNIARCFEHLKRWNEAFRWYMEILGERDLSPEDREAVNAAVQRMAPSLALVRVETDPPGATVYIDRRDLGGRGQTPLLLAVPPGHTKVLTELDGYFPAEDETSAVVGKQADVRLKLDRILGTLTAPGAPAKVELRVDSPEAAPVLTAPGSVQLAPGTHRLYVSAPGSLPQQLDADVRPQAEETVSFKLLPLPPPAGAWGVRANLDGALVRVDGEPAGFTPVVIDKVRAGQHKLEIVGEGREPYLATVKG